MKNLNKAFWKLKSLSNPVIWEILGVINDNPGRCQIDIWIALERNGCSIVQSFLSQKLNHMKEMGFIFDRKYGKFRKYYINKPEIEKIVNVIQEICTSI